MYVRTLLTRLMDNAAANPAIYYFLKALEDDRISFYYKIGEVQAIKALVATRVVTEISGEQETVNTANPGDYIVTGAAGEKYVLTAEKFESRYEHKAGNIYKATGGCYAVQYSGRDFTFTAPWNEDMICKDGDYICSTVLTGEDVYRIEQMVFLQTYRNQNFLKSTDLDKEPVVPVTGE